MWNRLQTTSSVTTLLQVPAELLPHNLSINLNLNLNGNSIKRPHRRPDNNTKNDTEERFWQESFDSRLNGIGIYENVPYKYPYKYQISRGKAVPSPHDTPDLESDDSTKMDSRVAQPVRQLPPPRNPRRRQQSDPNRRPVSSVYIVDEDPMYSGRNAMYANPTRGVDQVSPPSSSDGHMDHDVSPIDDEPDKFQDLVVKTRDQLPTHTRNLSGDTKSGIPTARREKRRQQDAAAMANRAQHAPRLPSISGTSGAVLDRPPQVQSQNFGLATTITSETKRPPQTGASPSLGQRVHEQFGKTKAEPIDSRPAWNGASGRQAVIKPIRDDMNVAPLVAPSKVTGGRNAERDKDPPGGTTVFPADRPGSETSYDQRFTTSGNSTHTAAKNTTLTPRIDNATHHASALPNPAHAQSPFLPSNLTIPTSDLPPRLSIPNHDKAIKRKLPSRAAQSLVSTPVHSPPLTNKPLTASPQRSMMTSTKNNTQLGDSWLQQAAHFGINTYLKELSALGSQSDEEEEIRHPLSASVMERRRPLPGNQSPRTPSDEPLKISLRSASISNPLEAAKNLDRSASMKSMNKALPPAPPEMVQSRDRVAVLNAKLEALVHRRNNINKSIKQMTELMPKDDLLASFEVLRKREDEKRKVDSLKEELADIQQQEYDLGLKLHRAYKRQDRDAEYESGRLWVSRYSNN